MKALFTLLLFSFPAFAEIKVEFDPRIQLFEVIHALYEKEGGLQKLDPESGRYAGQILEFFKTQASHPAVKAYGVLRESGLQPTEALMVLIGHSGPAPDFKLNDEPGNFYTLKGGGYQNFKKFTEAMADFAKDSGFWDFLKRYESIRPSSVKEIMRRLEASDYAGAVKEYTGLKVEAEYHLFPASFHVMNLPQDFCHHQKKMVHLQCLLLWVLIRLRLFRLVTCLTVSMRSHKILL